MSEQAHPMSAHFISNKAARRSLGVGSTTLQRWRQSGKLPYVKVGQIIFYRTSEINAFIESGGESAEVTQ